jgi:hypothetical protein
MICCELVLGRNSMLQAPSISQSIESVFLSSNHAITLLHLRILPDSSTGRRYSAKLSGNTWLTGRQNKWEGPVVL